MRASQAPITGRLKELSANTEEPLANRTAHDSLTMTTTMTLLRPTPVPPIRLAILV